MNPENPEKPILWKISNFIPDSQRLSFLHQVQCFLSPSNSTLNPSSNHPSILHVNETSNPLMRAGKVLGRFYGNSKRKIIKGSTIETELPNIKQFYYHFCPPLISQIVGVPLYPLDIHHSLALQILLYTTPGDTISPHVDECYLRQPQKVVTALFCLENQSCQKLCVDIDDPVSQIQQIQNMNIEDVKETYRTETKKEEDFVCVPMNDGDLIVFEHLKMVHSIRPVLQENESRIVVAMVFAEYPYSSTVGQYVWEKAKVISHQPVDKMMEPLAPPDRMFFFMVKVCVVLLFFILLLLIIFYRSTKSSETPEKRSKSKK